MKLLITTTILLFSFNVFGWNHFTNYQNGFSVSIDYQKTPIARPNGCYKCQGESYARPLYVNVSGPRITSNSQIRVVITNIVKYGFTDWVEKSSYVLDLTPQPEDHFSAPFSKARKLLGNQELDGNFKLTIYSSGYTGTYDIHQTVGVVIDGNWLNDFELNLWNH
jgi:hypothetical protein